MLSEVSEERRERITAYQDRPRPESADEDKSSSPVMDGFFEEEGAEAIKQMTNFTPSEFGSLWKTIANHVKSKWNVGRGRKSDQEPKDVLFMTLSVLKHGGTWDYMGRMFKIKGPTFEKLIMAFLKVVSGELYKVLVAKLRAKYSMEKEIEENKTFSKFPYCRYATDVTFQQTNRPTGNIQESKPYFSGKHKLYGYKVEVSGIPRGFAIGCTTHFAGSINDIDIFYDNLEFHELALQKNESSEVEDDGYLVAKYPDQWGILADKGYQGAAHHIRLIHPMRKPTSRDLFLSEIQMNNEISSDRIIVENFFGRLSSLWGVMTNKYRWKEDSYDMIFEMCLALTNLHIKFNPLRAEDLSFYDALQNFLYDIGSQRVQKRRNSQRSYRRRTMRRLTMEFEEEDGDDII